MNLTGQLLIAMPGMGDPRFEHSVVLVCAHSDEGAMGLIVNKPTEDVALEDLLEHIKIPKSPDSPQMGVHFGGPVETARGFVLHGKSYRSELNTLEVSGGTPEAEFGLTATIDVLEDLARGEGPQNAIVALGYSGWGPGQLEEEISLNGWLTCSADRELVFDTEDEAKWEAALKSMGVDALLLSAEAGHA
ncbi:YqgE/AlgH family protein [Thalassovita mediterranea]|jgi:putative transcriptional regulator|uniref:UPF0301 protein TM5383_01853 n=1 Tax=Thalassovita mediterranea TaxID=340021 RepID=A0A0P1GQE6_9RHOB|nr:YqgE/AlgH family protein [Thalassovita mediterranea]MCG7573957.1 YqgE/AlgH family protein [Phaeobacter sp. CNT1-3]CUH84641.1 hypothetical protein TM5383_01853 [Thalassovita mediterranea]SIS32309.1 putative transcriptional regulator [Thalassovita mediterranea]